MKTPIQRMIKILEDIVDEELNEDKTIAYGYCVYLAKTYLKDEKDAIIDAYLAGEEEWLTDSESARIHYTKQEAYKYYIDTFTK